MKQAWPIIKRRNNPGGTVSWMVDCGMINGKRQRHFFRSKTEAETKASQLRIARKNEGDNAFALPEKLRIEALECHGLLSGAGATLTEATRFFLKHAKPSGGTKGLSETIAELLESKRRSGKRESYVKILGWVLNAFQRDFEGRNTNEILRQEIETWLDKNFTNLTTRKNRIRDLSILFEFARRRGYCGSNPLEHIERPMVTAKRPEIFTVHQAVAMLNAAESNPALGLVPTLATGLFAGLRMSEIKLLDWRHIDFEHKVIDVSEEIAKTRQQRNVDMSEALIAWLNPHSQHEGKIVPAGFRAKLLRLRELAGIKHWPDNGLRHSFGSYHVAHFQNPNMTALQMGHTTTDMLFRHYRNYRINKKDAARYWQIEPSADSRAKIVAMTKR